jgi:hypothetical protein
MVNLIPFAFRFYSDLFTDQILTIHAAIKNIPDDLDFSEPTTLTHLPFPSPLPLPLHRFEATKHNSVKCFPYMGRSKFHELWSHMQRPSFLDGDENLYLYGSSGSGKSHILAALACRLIRDGEQVVYVPDCASLLADFPKTVRTALCCAFHDSVFLETINSALDVDALLEFWDEHRHLYFIVDQLNVLEVGGHTASLDDEKRQVMKWLNKMQLNHKYIFSASANEKSNAQFDMKQSGTTVIRFLGGMNEVYEMP